MSGYSLQQLLSWCVADHLIDSFAVRGDTIFLFRNQEGVELSTSAAQEYLLALIREKVTMRPEPSHRNKA